MSPFTIILLLMGVSQVYWAWRGYSLAARRIPSRGRRLAMCGAGLAVYVLLYQFTFGVWREPGTPVHLTVRDALLAAPFLWWMASSFIAFLVAMLFAIPRAITRQREVSGK